MSVEVCVVSCLETLDIAREGRVLVGRTCPKEAGCYKDECYVYSMFQEAVCVGYCLWDIAYQY